MGTQSNAAGIGARLTVTLKTKDGGSRKVHTRVSSGGSFGASSFRQHIGLGDAVAIRSLTIRWPTSGTVQTFQNPEMDRFYKVVEGKDALLPR